MFAVIVPLAVVTLTACSRTVEWDEEVPLNTGDTVWVHRSAVYELGGSAGNPLDIVWRTKRGQSQLTFEWHGRNYRFDLHGGPQMLAISPQGRPVLLAAAEAGSWDMRNRYRCTTPFYVQFEPDESGQRWTWPDRVDPALYNLPTNLLLAIPGPEDAKRRFSANERATLHARVLARSPERQRIVADFGGDKCQAKARP